MLKRMVSPKVKGFQRGGNVTQNYDEQKIFFFVSFESIK
jgi:hypothetical protein